jgi:hypothetical protein
MDSTSAGPDVVSCLTLSPRRRQPAPAPPKPTEPGRTAQAEAGIGPPPRRATDPATLRRSRRRSDSHARRGKRQSRRPTRPARTLLAGLPSGVASGVGGRRRSLASCQSDTPRCRAKQARPDDTNWTGAEIKSCCRLASLLDVPLVQAAQNVVPVAVTAGDKIEGLRQWASGRCLSADRAGVYSRSEVGSGGRVRRVVRAH